ncbi:MAG TPA: hypothetical protein VEI02_03395, partial [Planctomycetota bacterium]|nr:hypothetical protein [Planctomycetota bacterium]
WLVVDAEAETRRSAFRISELTPKLADRENEIRWLRNRIGVKRARLDVEAAMKRAGLDRRDVPTRRTTPGRRPGAGS